jgi:hypothetical protein
MTMTVYADELLFLAATLQELLDAGDEKRLTARLSNNVKAIIAALEAAAHTTDLLDALKGMIAEFDKFSRYGSPIARDANEAMRHARAAIAKAEGG